MLSNSISGLFYLQENITALSEIKVHLIHRKQAPLLHNTVLVLWIGVCDFVNIIL